MSSRADLPVAVVLAVLAHIGMAAAAAWVGRQRPIMPQFEFGDSSVLLTLAPAPPPPPVMPPPPAPPPPAEPLPVLESSPLPPLPEPRAEPVGESPSESHPEPAPPLPPDPLPPRPPDGDWRHKGVLTTAIDTSDIRPRYPLGARLRGEEGWVLLAIRVGRNGRADAVTIAESSGFHALDQAALQAALQAAYIGADGRTRAGETEVSVRFRLED